MGIDATSFDAVLLSFTHLTNKNAALTLGRQGLHMSLDIINYILTNYGHLNLIDKVHGKYCEKLFEEFGFNELDSLDYSSYEGASIIHDMNKPLEVTKKYDYIYDGGTIEHIFNAPQVLENIINLLEIDGIFCSVTCNNNFSGHGMYQFSPEFFLSTLTPKYGMEIKELFIAKINSKYENWINVNSYKGWRNNSRISTNEEVYIITVAKKISDVRENLILNPPQQYSYENVDWLREPTVPSNTLPN